MRLVSVDRHDGAGGARHPGPRLVRMAAALAFGSLLVAGCRVPGFSSSGSEPSVTATLNVVATPGVENAPLYVGIKQGMFQQAGLTINVKELTSVQAEVAALREGHADIAFADYADMFYAEEQKPDPHLVIVADGYDAQPNVMEVLALPSNHIVSPPDLTGKRIGTPDAQVMPAVVASQAGRPYSLETIATQ
jgi:NitT/TauT family transport system substrate-binding protein